MDQYVAAAGGVNFGQSRCPSSTSISLAITIGIESLSDPLTFLGGASNLTWRARVGGHDRCSAIVGICGDGEAMQYSPGRSCLPFSFDNASVAEGAQRVNRRTKAKPRWCYIQYITVERKEQSKLHVVLCEQGEDARAGTGDGESVSGAGDMERAVGKGPWRMKIRKGVVRPDFRSRFSAEGGTVSHGCLRLWLPAIGSR